MSFVYFSLGFLSTAWIFEYGAGKTLADFLTNNTFSVILPTAMSVNPEDVGELQMLHLLLTVLSVMAG